MVEMPMLETIAAFNSIEMLGGHAFVPPIGPAGYKRMKERRPVRTKDGWLTMLPYSGDNWCAFFEAVGHPECIEEFCGARSRLRAARTSTSIYKKMAEIALTRTTAEWEELLLRIDVPHAAFAKVTEIAEQPHLKAVGMFVDARPSDRRSDPTGAALGQILRKPRHDPAHAAAARRAFAGRVAGGGLERCRDRGAGREEGGGGS